MCKDEQLDIRTENISDGILVRLTGAITMSCAAMLRQRLRTIQKSRPARLVIDLGAVPHMDTSGVATFVEVLQNARRTDSRFILCAVNDHVRGILEITRLDTVFSIVDSVEEASVL